MNIVSLKTNYNILCFVTDSSQSPLTPWVFSTVFDDVGFPDEFSRAGVASMATFSASNGESYAFLFLWSLNHIVGPKVRIDTGD